MNSRLRRLSHPIFLARPWIRNVFTTVFTLPMVLAASSTHAATYYVRTGGGTTSQCTGLANADYQGSGSACAYKDLQAAIDAATFGDTIALHAGQVWTISDAFASFNLADKGSPPTRTDADYITITTDDPSGTPTALFGYPARDVRITTAMAARMPTVRTTGSEPVFRFKANSKYWKIERLNITNVDAGVQCIRLVGMDDLTKAQNPDHIIFQLNWLHPVEETGAVMDSSNVARTAENAFYLQGTNLAFRQNAMQGFAGRFKYGGDAGVRMTSSDLLIGNWADNVVLENNLLEAWTYAFFAGGSGFIPDPGMQATVSNCTSTSCLFSNTSGLQVGDPVAIYVSNASQPVWGNAFVTSISGNSVSYSKGLCHSYDGGNSCAPVGTVPSNGNTAQWGGYQPQNIMVRQNLFAHRPEWTTQLTDCGGKGYAEIKSCVNCVFDGNTFSGCTGVTVTVRNQGGDGPWASVDGLTFSNNYFKNSNQTFTAVLVDGGNLTRRSRNVTWTNNLMVGLVLSPSLYGGFLSSNFQGGDHVTITHNTALYSNYRNFLSGVPNPMDQLTMRDNIFRVAPNVCFTDNAGTSGTSIPNCWPTPVIDRNVLINVDGWSTSDISSWWPYQGNFVAGSIANVGFVAPSAALDGAGNYRLSAASPYRNAASDGTDIGVNYNTLIGHLGYDPNSSPGGTLPAAPTNLTVTP